jgi:hypothetical protein
VLEFLNNLGDYRNRVGIGLSYRSALLHKLAESNPGLLKSLKFGLWLPTLVALVAALKRRKMVPLLVRVLFKTE